MARFLKPDPYGGSGKPDNPQSWNRYTYVTNDPVNFNDPSSLKKFDFAPDYQGYSTGSESTLPSVPSETPAEETAAHNASSTDPAALLPPCPPVHLFTAIAGVGGSLIAGFGGGEASVGIIQNGTQVGGFGSLGVGVRIRRVCSWGT